MNKRKILNLLRTYSILLGIGLLTACGGGGGGDSSTTPPPPANTSPTSNAGADQIVLQGNSISLSGSASDNDGSISATQWQQTGGQSVTLSGDTTLSASFDAPVVGAITTLTFSLTVTDDDNATSTDTVSVTILPDDNNRVLLGPLIGANVVASRASNIAGTIETTTS